MARALVTCSLVLWVAAAPSPADAQGADRISLGVSTAAEGGSRGAIPSGTIGSVGGIVHVRIAGGWSTEVEVERAFRDTARVAESVWTSVAPPNSSREEIERLGVRARFERSERARAGVAALAVWRTRKPGRLNGAVSVGMSTRRFDTRVIRTITSVPPGYSLVDTRWPNDDSTRARRGTGFTVGAQLISSITRQFNSGLEVRCTSGIISGDDVYRVCRAGVRLMWTP